MNTNLIQGVVIGGTIKGLRERKWDGKIVGYELGVTSQVPDGFGGFSEDLMILRVAEDQHAHVANAVTKLRGKQALIQVSVGAFNSKGKPTAQFTYQSDTPILCLDDVDPFTGEIKDAKKVA